MSIFGSSAAAATDTSGEPTDDIMTGFRRRSRRRRLQVDDGYEGGNFLDDDDENYPDSAAAGRSGGGAATPPLLRGTSSAATAGTSSSSQPSDRSRDSSYGAALGLEVACLVAENLALHPFLVLRRQCQVSGEAQLYHLAPVPGLLPVAFRLCQWQGVGSLFKGLSSTLIVRGLQMAAEDAAVKVADLPKELSAVSPREVWRHLSLKALGLAAAAPFFTVSVIETVQSDIASEKPGVLDVFIEGNLCSFFPTGLTQDNEWPCSHHDLKPACWDFRFQQAIRWFPSPFGYPLNDADVVPPAAHGSLRLGPLHGVPGIFVLFPADLFDGPETLWPKPAGQRV